MVLSRVQNETIYHAIQETHDETGCSISELCVFAGIPRSSYYKWLNRKEGKNEQFNSQLLPRIKEAYEEKKVFKKKLDNAGMTQSMSRVSRCIDNGPMEAFWGIENRTVLLKDICLL